VFLSGFKVFFRIFSIVYFLFWVFESQANSHIVTPADGDLMRLAHTQKEKAFIPGGRTAYKVGVVLLLDDGTIVTGANIKMANGLTLCAERVALSKALIDQGLNESNLIQKIYVVNNQEDSSAPCGVCRQSLSFFTRPETLFFFEGKNNREVIVQSMKDLFPHPYIWRYAPSQKLFSQEAKGSG
jgi:cytidine deaminase